MDLQHGAVCGGRDHGGRGSRLPDPPGPGQQEEEERFPDASKRWGGPAPGSSIFSDYKQTTDAEILHPMTHINLIIFYQDTGGETCSRRKRRSWRR